MNNFFASVERVLNPSLVGKPLAVCGDPNERRGIVLAKCEVAKKAGVKTGDTVWMAKQKCPGIQIVSPTRGAYSKYARAVQEIYYRFTNLVESFGQDECWLDVTASRTLFGSGEEIAEKLRNLVKDELSLTISVGVSWNKTFAKLGSDIKKPDAVTVINRANFKEIVWNLPAQDMLGVGRKTAKLLNKLGVRTIGDLANFDEVALKAHIGIHAEKIIRAARGECDEPVEDFHTTDDVKSVGNGATLPRDLTTLKEVEKVIYVLSEEVGTRMRRKGVRGTTISLGVRDSDLRWHGAQTTIHTPTSHAKTITKSALEIFSKLWLDKNSTHSDVTLEPIRSLRVSVSNLTTGEASQLDMFTQSEDEKTKKFDKLFDSLRQKYGSKIVAFGTAQGSELDINFDSGCPINPKD